jgi:hypothetical protein
MQMINIPMVATKFYHLKYLEIYLECLPPEYDFWSLGSFLDASPVLEAFILSVSCCYCKVTFLYESYLVSNIGGELTI